MVNFVQDANAAVVTVPTFDPATPPYTTENKDPQTGKTIKTIKYTWPVYVPDAEGHKANYILKITGDNNRLGRNGIYPMQDGKSAILSVIPSAELCANVKAKLQQPMLQAVHEKLRKYHSNPRIATAVTVDQFMDRSAIHHKFGFLVRDGAQKKDRNTQDFTEEKWPDEMTGNVPYSNGKPDPQQIKILDASDQPYDPTALGGAKLLVGFLHVKSISITRDTYRLNCVWVKLKIAEGRYINPNELNDLESHVSVGPLVSMDQPVSTGYVSAPMAISMDPAPTVDAGAMLALSSQPIAEDPLGKRKMEPSPQISAGAGQKRAKH